MTNNGETIIIEFPSDLKGMADAVQAFLSEVKKVRADHSKGGGAVDYERVEKQYGELSARIECEAHGATLRSLASDANRVSIRGKLCASVGTFTADFFTKSGPTPVPRKLFREVGVRNGPTFDPVALRIGAVQEHWLPGTAKSIAHLVQQGTSREAEVTAQEMGRLPYSRTSMERIAHAVGTLFVAQSADIEDRLIEEVQIPEGTAGISVSVDRAALAMEEPRPRPKGRPRKNAPKNPISRAWRMAYCATVTLHDSKGKALYTERFGWTPGTDVESISDLLARNVASLLLRNPRLKLSLLTDGSEDVQNILGTYINREWQGVEVTSLIDYWHVVEKLAAAARAMFPEAERKAILARWKKFLLTSSSAHASILAELRASEKEWVRIGGEAPVHAAITYLENQGHRMDYRRARRAGFPIGSGNVEATCKSLIQVRMRRSGSRWKEQTAQHILSLRAVALSDLWNDAISMALESLRTSVRNVCRAA
ncbi:MAG: ISKra4 family transposase [Deltaproteobacteria bacterium]|nr:ISKra4 family transposase [Deltaproteobacteria bacterium]